MFHFVLGLLVLSVHTSEKNLIRMPLIVEDSNKTSYQPSFFMLNEPIFPSLTLHILIRTAVLLVDLCWTWSSMSVLFLFWGAPKWSWSSQCGLKSATQRGRTCWLHLLTLTGTGLPVFVASACCWHAQVIVHEYLQHLQSCLLASWLPSLCTVLSLLRCRTAFTSAIKQGVAFTVLEWNLGYFSLFHTTQLWRNSSITYCHLFFYNMWCMGGGNDWIKLQSII